MLTPLQGIHKWHPPSYHFSKSAGGTKSHLSQISDGNPMAKPRKRSSGSGAGEKFPPSGLYQILGQIRQRVDCLSACIIAYLFSFETNSLRMPTGAYWRENGRSETWQFAKNQFWSDFVRKQTFRESRQVLLSRRMRRGFEFVLILQTTRGSNFG
ncbi:hypothetical protein AVEN_42506-1 [Araneus ventricosus]|uniref:Uncharacterized protein n=1 Tax=Araneus ventricosus TaxID=182803 RepID=A0A4Y2TNF5_ARAVE|nr:hypothetical protein AVEN_42506-1 [Araneus ventricosus]